MNKIFWLNAIPLLCLSSCAAGGQSSISSSSSSSSSSFSSSSSSSSVCEKKPLDVYILSGQSNMVGYSPISGLPSGIQNKKYENGWYYVKGEGNANHGGANYEQWTDVLKPSLFGLDSTHFGPEVGMSEVFESLYPEVDGDRSLAIIKYSQGGSALYNRWFSSSIYKKGNGSQLAVDAAGTSLPNRTLEGNVVGDLYYNPVTTVRKCLDFLSRNYCVNVKGLAWMQGEHDSVNDNAYYYETNLTDFISDLRKNLSLPAMKVAIGEIYSNISGTLHTDVVKAAEKKVAENDEHADFISTEDLSVNFGGDAHFDGPSMFTLGKRFANSLK